MATFTVATEQDTLDEPDETFTVTLSSPSNATLATDPTAAGTITDDDDPPTLSVADASATEGSAVTFTVTLSPASGREATVDWATSAETGDTAATSGTDFTAANDTLTFMPGDTTATFTVATAEDTTRRARRDLHGDPVEPVERDPGDGPDGGRHDRGQRCGQQRPVVHLFNDLQPGGEPDGGGHGGDGGQDDDTGDAITGYEITAAARRTRASSPSAATPGC